MVKDFHVTSALLSLCVYELLELFLSSVTQREEKPILSFQRKDNSIHTSCLPPKCRLKKARKARNRSTRGFSWSSRVASMC